jgi:hypothetical protein
MTMEAINRYPACRVQQRLVHPSCGSNVAGRLSGEWIRCIVASVDQVYSSFSIQMCFELRMLCLIMNVTQPRSLRAASNGSGSLDLCTPQSELAPGSNELVVVLNKNDS